jgi:hypothetical protein
MFSVLALDCSPLRHYSLRSVPQCACRSAHRSCFDSGGRESMVAPSRS